MTLGGIQLGGLASGLDTGALIDAILAFESRSVRAMEGRKAGEQAKLTLIGTFEGLVNKLKDKARELQVAGNFFAHALTVGQEGYAAFTTSGGAEAGAHTLEIFALAAADRYAFAGVADPEAALGTGTVSFTYAGTPYSVNVIAGSDNLTDIAAAINTAAGAEVTASVVNVGTEAAPSYQLVIAGDETGADFTLTGLTSSVTGLSGATQVSIASNASIEIDGLAVQRSGNLFSNVLPGVSFTVSRTTELDVPLTFTVAVDPAGIRENIKGFVDAYNETIGFINKQNTFSLDSGPGGALFGDNVLESIRTNLRRALFTPDRTVFAAAPDYGSFGTLGIELQGDGTLKIDETKLDAKLTTDLDAFEQFFNRADDLVTSTVDERGVFVKLEEILDGLLDTRTSLDGTTAIEGLFKSRRTSGNRQIRDFDREIERLEFRLEKLEESLVRKFAALEQLLGGMQAQQAFLSSSMAFPDFQR